MEGLPHRKPVAIANWKMAMTVSEGIDFVKKFRATVDNIAHSVNIVLCPPYTSIYPLSQELSDSPIELGAQNLFAGRGKIHTGEISARLLAEAGCKWVMLGHWEVRRRTGETDSDINTKMHAALEAGLRPILLIGERTAEKDKAKDVLASRLPDLFGDCKPRQSAQAIIIYEPEWTIGAKAPASAVYIADCCFFIRNWIGQKFGVDVAEAVRIIYGGSVAPEHSKRLLTSRDVDGLGAGRMGRDPMAFGRIVRQIAASKGQRS